MIRLEASRLASDFFPRDRPAVRGRSARLLTARPCGKHTVNRQPPHLIRPSACDCGHCRYAGHGDAGCLYQLVPHQRERPRRLIGSRRAWQCEHQTGPLHGTHLRAAQFDRLAVVQPFKRWRYPARAADATALALPPGHFDGSATAQA